jgi:hypothetical protein
MLSLNLILLLLSLILKGQMHSHGNQPIRPSFVHASYSCTPFDRINGYRWAVGYRFDDIRSFRDNMPDMNDYIEQGNSAVQTITDLRVFNSPNLIVIPIP